MPCKRESTKGFSSSLRERKRRCWSTRTHSRQSQLSIPSLLTCGGCWMPGEQPGNIVSRSRRRRRFYLPYPRNVRKGDEHDGPEAKQEAPQQEIWDRLGEPSGKSDFLVKYTAPPHWNQPVGEPSGWGEEPERRPRERSPSAIQFGMRRPPRFVKPQLKAPVKQWRVVQHRKFPQPLTRTQKRRLQRKRAAARRELEKQQQRLMEISLGDKSKFRRKATEDDRESVASDKVDQKDERSSFMVGEIPVPFCTLLSLTLPAVFQGSQDPDEDPPEDPEEMVEGRVEEEPEEDPEEMIEERVEEEAEEDPEEYSEEMKVTVNPEGFISNRLKALLAQRAQKVPMEEVAGEPEVTCQVTIQSKPGEPKKVVLDKASPQMTQDIKPLYVKAHLNGKPVSRILVDNGSAVNVLPLKMIWSLGKSLEDLMSTEVSVVAFTGEATKVVGVLPLEITVGTKTSLSAFFVVNTSAHYLALLGRDWIHANQCVPSTLHQFLLLWKGDDVEIVWADDKPFQTVEDAVDARYYDPNCGPIIFLGG